MAEPLLTPEQLAELAAEPAEAEVDRQRVKNRPLGELLDAEKRDAFNKCPRPTGIRLIRLVPPGASC